MEQTNFKIKVKENKKGRGLLVFKLGIRFLDLFSVQRGRKRINGMLGMNSSQKFIKDVDVFVIK